ncbi:MAG: ABC transporter ATP-binding protein [Rhizobiaceae bacterium]|nr:ABC transporter ATP-binding protein [Rhizobiaceae bacterium]
MTMSPAVSGNAEIDGGVPVQLVDLQRRYGSVRALDGLSLDIRPGELVALLGPSGCGKTTALRAVAGLERVDEGKIVIGSADVTQLATSSRDIGMVFQAYSLFPHMTALENVAFGLLMRRMGKAERRRIAKHFLEVVGLADRAQRYPHQLSGGQQQRVALARALAIQPSVLLLDEPLSALDAKVRTQLRDEIRRIQLELRTTTLFVTHDQEEAMAAADRVAVMHAGRIEQIATPIELYERPCSQRVAEFVGISNRLRGEVRNGMAMVLDCTVPVLDGSVSEGAAIVLVRPECLDLVPDTEGTGRVVAASFLGPIARVQVRLHDDTLVQAQIASADVARFGHGSSVKVVVRPSPALAVTMRK